jgi:hypothetical protein
MALFAKFSIGYWIPIQPMRCAFSLDFKNMLLPKHNIGSLMPLLFFIGYHFNEKAKGPWMQEDEFNLYPSISHQQH